MILATWNVNSLKVRLPHVLDWLSQHPVDVMCLQETKLIDDRFPENELRDAGYHSVFVGQKTYNGVAILVRAGLSKPEDVQINLPGFDDESRRFLALTLDGVRIVCVYVPNGQAVGTDKYAYKLRWLAACHEWLKAELRRHEQLVIAGDYNIAPEERDVHDPKLWEGQVMFSEPERAALRRLFDLGLKDAFRLFEQPERSYTWWDYRMLAFRRKMGLRIDHILLSTALAGKCTACLIDIEPRKREQPSDHAPVLATLS